MKPYSTILAKTFHLYMNNIHVVCFLYTPKNKESNTMSALRVTKPHPITSVLWLTNLKQPSSVVVVKTP